MDGRYADGTNPFTASMELTLAADGGMVHGQTPSFNRAFPPHATAITPVERCGVISYEDNYAPHRDTYQYGSCEKRQAGATVITQSARCCSDGQQ
ncbi:unnamed protein product [Boreogadus saida]